MTRSYEIRSGNHAVSVKTAASAQQALLDYVRSLGCADAEIIRLSSSTVSWRGAQYHAVPLSNGRE